MERIKKRFLVMLLLMTITVSLDNCDSGPSTGTGNPIIPCHWADPSMHYFNNTWYLYVTSMGSRIAWKSVNLRDWVMVPFTITNDDTSQTSFWAPSVAHANGKYYMYYSYGTNGMWVADSNSPEGPFTNRKQLTAGWTEIDPQPFQDTDGKWYLYWGGIGSARVARLNSDMISLAESPRSLSVPNYTEGPFMLKRNGYYLLSYSEGLFSDQGYRVQYAVSTSPYGPFTLGANSPILSTSDDKTVQGPGHHSIFSYNGKDYIIHQMFELPIHPDGVRRSPAVHEIVINSNGTINKINPSLAGVPGIGWRYENNLATGKTCTASSFKDNDHSASKACDENNNSRWEASNQSMPQWLAVDLGQNYSVTKTMLAFEWVKFWVKYKIEYSIDGSTWSLFVDRTNVTTGKGLITDTNSAVTARYLRITVTGTEPTNKANMAASIVEFKVFQ